MRNSHRSGLSSGCSSGPNSPRLLGRCERRLVSSLLSRAKPNRLCRSGPRAQSPPSSGGSVFWFALRRGGLEIAQRREPGERLALELPDPLAGQVELVTDRLQRPRLALEAEAKLQDPALPLGQSV